MSQPQQRRRRRWKRLDLLAGEWVVLFAVWLLFTWSLEPAELALGLATSLGAAIASHLVWVEHLVALSLHPGWLAQVWRIPGAVVLETGGALRVLAVRLFTGRLPPSRIAEVPFAHRGSDAEAATLRALAIGLGTLTPNVIVIGIDAQRGTMIFHQLWPSPLSRLARSLGAGTGP